MRVSPLQPHQSTCDGSEQVGSLGALRHGTALVQPVRQPLTGFKPFVAGQHTEQVVEHHSQGFGQPFGRQHGRRARRLRQEA